MRANKGFTMLELIVVALIVGICITVGVPGYINMIEDAKVSEAQKTLNQISQGCFDFYTENETFTGVTIAAINTRLGVNFVNNADWTFAVASTDSTFTVTAQRLRGAHTGQTIIINQDNTISGTYPLP